MKKALPAILVLIGTALLITAVVFWIDSSTSTEPQGFGKTLLDWITLIAGLGASIKGWMDLFKKEKPTPPTTKIDVKGGTPQISTGDHARNIQADTYIENQTIQQPSELKTPKSLRQLPVPPLDFVGREKELTQLHQNIEKGVLISGVQGMGGIGKTALGLKLAEQITPDYPDGQIYLDLRGAHEQTPLTPEQVMAHIIRSFHPEVALPIDFGELGAMYRSTLSGKSVLLFYDNARDENQLHSLLPPKSCMLFVTSRQYFTLPGFDAINLDTLNPQDARNLVQEIASNVNDKDADDLAKQCGFLPLAIRAAVSVLPLRPDWSASRLIQRLSDNRTKLGLVESSLSLSYQSLGDDLQNYLRQLGVFAIPFDKEAIIAVWEIRSSDRSLILEEDAKNEISSDEKVEGIIGNILKTNLLKYDSNSGEYFFHDLTHLFLEAKLRQDKNAHEVLWRYARYYLKLGNDADDDFSKGEEVFTTALTRFRKYWLHINAVSERLVPDLESVWKLPDDSEQWLKMSLGNVQTILYTCYAPKDYLSFAQRALDAAERLNDKDRVSAYQNFLGATYVALGDARRAIQYFVNALDNTRETGQRKDEATTLVNMGGAYEALGDTQKVIEYSVKALDIAREISDKTTEGKALTSAGIAYLNLGDARKAIEYQEQARAIAHEAGDRKDEAAALGNLGGAYTRLGNARKAIEYYEQARAFAREIGDRNTESKTLGNLGGAYSALGDENKAIKYYEQALVIAQEIDNRRMEGIILCNLGSAHRSAGKLDAALEYHKQGLKISKDIGDRHGEGVDWDNLANVYADKGDYDNALLSYQSAMAISKEVGDISLEANIAWNIATIYYEKQQYDLAAQYIQITVDFEQKINHPNTVSDLEALNRVRTKIKNLRKRKENQ